MTERKGQGTVVSLLPWKSCLEPQGPFPWDLRTVGQNRRPSIQREEEKGFLLFGERQSEKGRAQKLPLLPGRQVTTLSRGQTGSRGMLDTWQTVRGTWCGGATPQDFPEVVVSVEVREARSGTWAASQRGPSAKASV